MHPPCKSVQKWISNQDTTFLAFHISQCSFWLDHCEGLGWADTGKLTNLEHEWQFIASTLEKCVPSPVDCQGAESVKRLAMSTQHQNRHRSTGTPFRSICTVQCTRSAEGLSAISTFFGSSSPNLGIAKSRTTGAKLVQIHHVMGRDKLGQK